MSQYLALCNRLRELPTSDLDTCVRSFIEYCESSSESKDLGNLDQVTVKKFMNWVQERGLLSQLEQFLNNEWAASSVSRGASQPKIYFANRQKEIDQIMKLADSRINRPVFISAPSGFGKSALLHEVAERFEAKNYDCALVSADRTTTIVQLVEAFSDKLGLRFEVTNQSTTESLPLGELFASRWKKRYTDRLATKKNLTGLILLVDFSDVPAKSLIDALIKSFITECWYTLQDCRDFANHQAHVRLIVAGRALDTLGLPNNPELMILSPFTYKAVKDTVQMYLPHIDPPEQARIAAHVLYLTGGYPRCMAKLLDTFVHEGRRADRYFASSRGSYIWEKVIHPTVTDFEHELEVKLPSLHEVIEAICVFRYVDHDILQRHCTEYQPHGYCNSEQLADLLTQSYLFTGGPYLSDGICRQLVTLKLRYENPNRLEQLCKSAANLCLQQIKDVHINEPWMWALEYLFQRLQNQTLNPHDQAEDRHSRLQAYLDTEVPLVVAAIYDRQPKWHHFRQFIQFMDEKLSDEYTSKYGYWEFIFLFNYLFRAEEYDDKPINALRKALNINSTRDRYKLAAMNRGEI